VKTETVITIILSKRAGMVEAGYQL